MRGLRAILAGAAAHRKLFLVLPFLALAAPMPAQAQESLGGIRADLDRLGGMLGTLRRELTAGGGGGGAKVAGSVLERVDALEAEQARLTREIEALGQRIERVVADGTRQVGDLRFRLCELEPGCDIGALDPAAPLGGASEAPQAAAGPAGGTADAGGGAELAVGERADFDRAKEALDSGSFQSAADLLASFAETYPGSPLTGQARMLEGDALLGLGDTRAAAKAWLAGYSADKTGPFAAETLLKLGTALNTLGQAADACAILGEVPNRFAGTPAAQRAAEVRATLGCP